MTDSRVMGLRVAYIFHDPNRFDIILFTPPDDETSLPYVKRIIGLPNEKVEIIDGKVYIDDSNTPRLGASSEEITQSGTPDLSIIGVTPDSSEVAIFTDGNFALQEEN